MRGYVADALEESFYLRWVEGQGLELVAELEGVDDDSGVVGEGVGFDDVHAPGGEHSGYVGEEVGAVGGDEGDLVELAQGAEGDLDADLRRG